MDYTTINIPNSARTQAWGINNDDQIVGIYVGISTPIPASIVLLVSGLIGMAGIGISRRN